MANSIELFKSYTTLLDEVYKQSSLTSELDGAPELVTQGANANELIIPMMSMDGLADYSRNSGYVGGDGLYSQVMNIRVKLARHKKLDKTEREYFKEHKELISPKPKLSPAEQKELDEEMAFINSLA